ncbi:hypothetical protein [Pedobacter paludis]|uniref:Uncharacterized protein n=1 Tax=Pedobacter paludis TaxID=2203212 RepID=A0A317EYY9_9SPHI|nr:hypothetical protein [Pedobacter paludis]PWS32190.1 hypothetical protein DF947_10495 [Pedobacter paludis]
MEKELLNGIETVAKVLEEKGYKDHYRIAGVGKYAPLREALTTYFSLLDMGYPCATSPLKVFAVLESVSPGDPYSHISIVFDEPKNGILNPSGYILRRMECWEGNQIGLVERKIGSSKELPTAMEAQEMLLKSEAKEKLPKRNKMPRHKI